MAQQMNPMMGMGMPGMGMGGGPAGGGPDPSTFGGMGVARPGLGAVGGRVPQLLCEDAEPRSIAATGPGPRHDREQDTWNVSVRGAGSASLRPGAVWQPRPALAVGKRDESHHSGDFPRAVAATV